MVIREKMGFNLRLEAKPMESGCNIIKTFVPEIENPLIADLDKMFGV